MQQPTQFRGSIQTGAMAAPPSAPPLIVQVLEVYRDGERLMFDALCHGQQMLFELTTHCAQYHPALQYGQWLKVMLETARGSLSDTPKKVIAIQPTHPPASVVTAD